MPTSTSTSVLLDEWGNNLTAISAGDSLHVCTVTEAVNAVWTEWIIEAHHDLIGSSDIFIIRSGGLWAMVKVDNCFDDDHGGLVTWEEFTAAERAEVIAAAVRDTVVVEDVEDLLRAWLVPDRFTGKVPAERADWALTLLSVERPEVVQARVRVAQGAFGPVHVVLAERERARRFAAASLDRFDARAVADRILADLDLL